MVSSESLLAVGSKGEIYTNDELRRKVGIKKGGKVRARVSGDKLVIEPLPSLEEVLAVPVIMMTPEKAEKLSEEAQKEAGAYG
jgi:bifunctional DNA-binding transcriptional regulator/antitoxin component of YhaV-PrlF toxin-antitoxin module